MCEFGWIRILGVRARGFLGSLMEISTPSHKTLALSQSAAGIPGGFQGGETHPRGFIGKLGLGFLGRVCWVRGGESVWGRRGHCKPRVVGEMKARWAGNEGSLSFPRSVGKDSVSPGS